MADIFTKKKRSDIMSKIRGKHTKPELIVRRYLFSLGFRYRVHDKKLPGTPDIVLKKHKTVLLVQGCFWHGHKGCKSIPSSNMEFWRNKISNNIKRDKKNIRILRKGNWRVIKLWECGLKRKTRTQSLEKVVEQIMRPI